MVIKDDLFQLIKSLNASERRYFKIFASRHVDVDEHNLSELFDEVERLDEYDEDKLKKKLAKRKSGKSIIKYISAEKKALHDLIMRAMRAYHGEKTVDVQLNELLTDELFYHGKSLYELQAKTLEKAKKLAEKYEKFTVLLTVLQREAKMLIERKTKDYDEVRNRVHKQEMETLEKLVNESELRILKDDVFIDTRTGANVRDENFQKALDEKIKNPLLKDEKRALSFHALKNYHNTLRAYYRLKSDMKKAWEHSKKVVEIFEANTDIKEEFTIDYKIALANYLGACHTLQKYDEFEKALAKIKSTPSKSLDEEGEVFQDTAMYELLYYMNTNRFSDAV